MFNIQTHMDFEGQARAEKVSRAIITFFGFVGLVFGAVIQQFSQTIYILAAGFILALLITIPPYPLYRKKPLNWQKSKSQAVDNGGEGSSSSSTTTSAKKSKQK